LKEQARLYSDPKTRALAVQLAAAAGTVLPVPSRQSVN